MAAVLFAGSMMASEAIMQYTGGSTTNMVGDGANNAATVGLDADLFTVLADKGSNQNLPGLNKANDIRLYADKNSGNGNIITVSIANGTITSIVLDIKQTATFVVKAGETAVTEENGAYAINATSFSIQNTTSGATTQLQLNKITITYTAEGGGEPVEPGDEPSVVYDWAGNIGTTFLGGNSNITTGTVKIHENADDINGIKFGSSYVYADGKYVAIKPAEGAFKAGDTLKVSVVFNNSDLTKYCMVDVYAADKETRLFRSDSATTLNGRLSAADPAVQKYILASDQDSLLIGRYGNTGMFVTFLQVVRPAASDEPVVLAAPAAAPEAPTYPANQVKAVYAATYEADCNFGEWGSGTTVAQEDFGKKYVTTNLGYFGLEFESLNCSQMEALHLDVWIADNASIGIVPIHGGTEVRVTKELVGQQWNSIDIPLSEFAGVESWANVYQIKIDNAANLTFWLNNVYFYTTVAPAADEIAPAEFTAAVVSASYFSANIQAYATDASGAVKYDVINGELIVATGSAASGANANIVVNGLMPGTEYNFSVVAKDESGNAAEPIALTALTLAAPAPAAAPAYAAEKVLALDAEGYTNIAYDIQNWYTMPAISDGMLSETAHALCILPNETAGSCFGMAFAPTDITAYDALEMDVYPTAEGAKLKIQVIGVGDAAAEYELVANQWNHISLDIKGNTKTNCEQVGFYDCHNILGACFVQNVLFVDTDEDITPEPQVYNVAEAIAAGFADDDEISVRGVITKMEFKGKNFAKYGSVNIYVADVNGAEGEFEFYNCYSLEADTFRASVPEYDAASTAWAEFTEVTDGNGVTVHVGDTIVAFGKYKLFNTTHELNTGCYITELKPAATAAETITINITEGTEWLDATADEGWWQIMGENEGYAVSLSNIGGAAEAAGTYTIDQMDPAYTYVKPVNGTEKITFTEGSVVVAVDAETEIVTVTATLLGTDGNTYDISMVYDPSKVDPYKYDEEVDDFEYTFESYIVNDKYVATNGILVVNAQSETTAITMYLIPEEGQTALTAGEYAVAAVPAYGTVLAGSYDQGVSPSYAATLVAEAGQLYLDQVWYFVSGKVTVDANLNIVVDALNSKGKAIKATLKGIEQGIEDVDAAAKAIKTIKNGQLIIEKNGVQYNAQGAVIR